MALIYYNHYLITFTIMISFLIQILSLHNTAVMVGMNTVRTNLFEYFCSSIFLANYSLCRRQIFSGTKCRVTVAAGESHASNNRC